MPERALAGVLDYVRSLVGLRGAAEQSDAALLRRFARDREEAALVNLLHRHGPLVLATCRQVLPDPNDAEDAFQVTFLVMVRKAATLRLNDSLAPWLHRVASRAALKIHAATQRRQTREKEAADMTPSLLDDALDETPADWAPVLHEEIDRLPEKYRAPLVLCYLQGRTQQEAAAELGRPLGTLGSQLNRARDLLHRRLVRRGVTLAAGALLTRADSSALAVPPSLLAVTTQTAIRFIGGETVPGRLVPVVQAVLADLAAFRWRVLLAMFLCSLVGIGLSALAHQPKAAPSPPRPPAAEAPVARTDRHGDLLPPSVLARFGTVRFRPGKQIGHVAISPDGKFVATTCETGLHLWDAETGKELRRFTAEYTSHVAFAPDGATLFADNWRAISAWNVSTGKVVREYAPQPPGNGIQVFALSPDGKTIAFGGADETVRLVEAATGRELHTLQGKRQHSRLAFSPDGKLLASDGTGDAFGVYLWDVATGKEVRQIGIGRLAPWAFAFSPDNKTLATVGTLFGDNTKQKAMVLLLDVATGNERHRMEIGGDYYGYSVGFSPDGKVLATGSDNHLLLWDPATGKEIANLPEGAAHSLTFTRDGGTLVTGSNFGAVRFWDTARHTERTPIEGGTNWIDKARWQPDGKGILSTTLDFQLHQWDRDTTRIARQFQPPHGVWVLLPDGRTLLILEKEVLTHWDLASGKGTRRFAAPWNEPPRAVSSADGKWLAVGGEKVVWIWDVEAGKVAREIRTPQETVWGLAFSPDGSRLATGDARSTLRVWDTRSGKEEHALAVKADEGPANPNVVFVNGNDYVDCCAFSPDGTLLAAGGTGPFVHVWELASGREIRRLVVRSGKYKDDFRILCMTFSPDGAMVLGSGFGTSVRLWEVASGSEIGSLVGHRGGVRSLAFSPDGKTLLTGSQDTTALVWDFARLSFIAPDAAPPVPADLAALWQDLGNPDARRAYRALQGLLAIPDQSLPWVASRLKPAEIKRPPTLAQRIAELDSDSFEVRTKAEEELAQMGEMAQAALERLLQDNPPLETQQRADRVLAQLKKPITDPDSLRQLRSVALLERIDHPTARRTLEQLARGTAEARLTCEAKAALQRLSKQP